MVNGVIHTSLQATRAGELHLAASDKAVDLDWAFLVMNGLHIHLRILSYLLKREFRFLQLMRLTVMVAETIFTGKYFIAFPAVVYKFRDMNCCDVAS